jgi:hypothetical protein
MKQQHLSLHSFVTLLAQGARLSVLSFDKIDVYNLDTAGEVCLTSGLSSIDRAIRSGSQVRGDWSLALHRSVDF